jgi:hypothetical protein
MAVSPNRRYIAAAEKGPSASVAIYDLHTLKKRKVRVTLTLVLGLCFLYAQSLCGCSRGITVAWQ